jgi:predicted nucleic acid-binding protein
LKRVVNASPIIFLNRLGLLDLLNEPGLVVLVPESVLNELARLGPKDPATVAVRSTPWLHFVPSPEIPDFLRAWNLGAGEAAVLALAVQETAPDKEVILDDWKARRRAEELGIRVGGTTGKPLNCEEPRSNSCCPTLIEEHRQSERPSD